VESGERWLTSVDSLDLLEILASFDAKLGRITDPQQLPKSLEDFETVVARLSQIHGLA
jgi:acyl carrier protein